MKVIIRGKAVDSVSTGSGDSHREKPGEKIQALIDRALKITRDYETQLSHISDPKLKASVEGK